MRDEQPSRAAVLRVERLALVLIGDPGLAAGEILERDVRRVAAITEREHIVCRGLHALEQRVE